MIADSIGFVLRTFPPSFWRSRFWWLRCTVAAGQRPNGSCHGSCCYPWA